MLGRQRVGGHQGFALIELLVVIAILAILAGVSVVALTRARGTAEVGVCRAEEGMIVRALEAARADNARHEYPGVAGPDGLDGVRAAGFLEWGTTSRYWAYVDPAGPDGITADDLIRVGLDRVPLDACRR